MNAIKTSSRRTQPRRIYPLRVALDEIEPSVWRRFGVSDALTLAKLDRITRTGMGWTNSHLHEFVIAGRSYCMPDDEWPGDEPMVDDRRHTVGSVLGAEVREVSYLYDFGDHRRHTAAIEQLMLPTRRTPGHRAWMVATRVRPRCRGG